MRKQDDTFISLLYETHKELFPEMYENITFDKFKLLYLQKCRENL